MVDGVFSALATPGRKRDGGGPRLPACAHLPAAYAVPIADAPLRELVRRFQNIEPFAEWRTRTDHTGTGNENYPDGHANAMIVGPGGLEDRTDVWLGATILAPHVRYPDHHHAPAEVYLVASEGDFQHGESGWFTPGIGGSFYNTPNIRHAMRSGEKPLFAFWTLLSDRAA